MRADAPPPPLMCVNDSVQIPGKDKKTLPLSFSDCLIGYFFYTGRECLLATTITTFSCRRAPTNWDSLASLTRLY